MARTNGQATVTGKPSTTDTAGRFARIMGAAPTLPQEPLAANVPSIHHVAMAMTTIDKVVVGTGTSKNGTLKDLDREHLRLNTVDKKSRNDPKGLRFPCYTKNLATALIAKLMETDEGAAILYGMGMRFDRIQDSKVEALLTERKELRKQKSELIERILDNQNPEVIDLIDQIDANLAGLNAKHLTETPTNRIANID